jgi:hypothetical protein
LASRVDRVAVPAGRIGLLVLGVVVLGLLVGGRLCLAEDRGAYHAEIQPFLKQHCFQCHRGDEAEAALRLDQLAAPAQDAVADEMWSRIVGVIASGEMPPVGSDRPDAAAIRSVNGAIAHQLLKSLSRPLALRRMNRVEYENTVRDLLGIDTSLADLLPEDGTVQGFDNVADGLTISPILMERYLQAADMAFDAVIRRFEPLPPATRRVEMMQNKENRDSVAKKKGGTIEVDRAFVKFRGGWPPVRLDEVHPIESGIYRCRIAVWPYQPGDRTLVAAVYVGPLFGPGKREFVGMFDVTGTSDDPRIIEFTTRMQEGHTMHIVPWVYPEHTHKSTDPKPGVAVAWAETQGPLDQSWPSEAQKRLFGETTQMVEGSPIWMRHRKNVRSHTVGSDQPEQDIERILSDLIPRAFRRGVDASEIAPFVRLAQARLAAGRSFEDSVRAGVTAVLCSPKFLLLNREPAVDDYTLASRLSYFLWSTMPDEELQELAAAGKLRDPAVLRAQTERMLSDPKIENFVLNFTGQWLDLRKIEFTTPDKRLYPEFDELLQESMLGETRGFFRHLLENDLSIRNFIASDFTVLNERIARHYGIEEIVGHEQFRVVELPRQSIRGGVLTQASVLKVTANGTSTSPILRGVWVIDKLLGQPAPPPPPGVPAVEPDIRGATSIREQIEQHRSIASCARCHVRIDPPGLALEHFDPIGGQRDWYRSLGEGERVQNMQYRVGPKVETHGQTPDGRTFADFREYRQTLLDDQELVAHALAEKLLIYGTGRRMTAADRPMIEGVVAATQKDQASQIDQLGLRAMIHAVVQSPLFSQP